MPPHFKLNNLFNEGFFSQFFFSKAYCREKNWQEGESLLKNDTIYDCAY